MHPKPNQSKTFPVSLLLTPFKNKVFEREHTVYVKRLLFVFPTGSTKEETAEPSQSSEGAELSLRAHGRKSIGELYIAHSDLTFLGEGN